MFALGISQDLYSGGVALSDGKRLLFAANEERYSRIKNHGGFPHQALAELFRQTGISPCEITDLALAGVLTPPLLLRIFPLLQERLRSAQDGKSESLLRPLADFAIHKTPIASRPPGPLAHALMHRILPLILARNLPKELSKARFHLVEHHPAHAYCAYHLSGFESALCITADGMGDGISWSISVGRQGKVERLAHGLPSDSFGLFFESLTEAFGHVPSRDEGKLTGLAAHGCGGNVKEEAPFIFRDGHIHYRGPHGLQAVRWIRNHLLATYSRVDVAAWAQENLETVMVAAARHWLAQTGESHLALGGGTFGNVKLNQRLHELPEVAQLYVAPNMGDGGNAAGALAGAGCLERYCLGDAFLGDRFSDVDIEGELKQSGLSYEHVAESSEAIAALLIHGKTVARFDGRMEWGPRALGNRSILAPATDSAVVERLNGQLRRSDFMPFAPAILAEEASSLLANHEAGLLAGEFMTVCFDCSPRMKAACPAVVHVDGTARAQIVHESKNPGMHGILAAYARQSGIGALLNTSFNIHEEPIVRTPSEAIRSFRDAGLDFLAIGPYIVRQAG